MLERFQAFLESLAGSAAPIKKGDPRVAVIALCLQVMEADGTVLAAERRKMREIIKEHYKLDDARLNRLVEAGETAESEAIDFYKFTTEIKRELSEEQRIELVGMLWEIVYADGVRNEIEDHVIWRIADLLGVSGRDRILKRQEVAARIDAKEKNDTQQED
ncbi:MULTISPECIES: TerB family tellurite resistance protein [unclassified Sinorhizobium]|uniref:tellurite resistance TerB family protein n=1 Tax=unclassified Sinorhizobium TaxID=2613772 RepID=UPI0024C36602|nr:MULTISPECIES: TerB family tellurite resistance protein [unclassified Sinorhizobium]MDK1377209.1 TerB family tellurite resistance protein [Sinorhizobium sp. 6-70]MDK1478824.1 TerB family tellurite resistance protein [Sinorhizobium sp. 6-117]